MPIILEDGLKCIEGAKPDEKVIGDNVLETLQPAHASVQHAARLDSNPEVCQDTIDQQEADAMAACLVYTDVEVMVELIAQADFKPHVLNLTGEGCMCLFETRQCMLCKGLYAAANVQCVCIMGCACVVTAAYVAGPRCTLCGCIQSVQSFCTAGDRKSKRARKGRAPVKVSADDTIRVLKLKIVQTLNVHPQNALIHVHRQGKWQVLDGDPEAKLAGDCTCCMGLHVAVVCNCRRRLLQSCCGHSTSLR